MRKAEKISISYGFNGRNKEEFINLLMKELCYHISFKPGSTVQMEVNIITSQPVKTIKKV